MPRSQPGPDVTTVAVRMPEGNRVSRRFSKSTEMLLVREWVKAASPVERPMCAFELVSTYPRFVASEENAHLTLEQAGMHPQATLYVREIDDENE